MADKTIRTHRERVKQANDMLKNHSRYSHERISIIDREAFVEFYLLEDIVTLYEKRLEGEKNYNPIGRADEKGRCTNIAKFSAIINVFNAAIGAARAAISSGDYKKVWRAIHEGPLVVAANSVRYLPKLREMAVELLCELSKDMSDAEVTAHGIDEDLDDLEAHEANVRNVKGIPTIADIEEVIRAAELAIPDKKGKSRLNNNI